MSAPFGDRAIRALIDHLDAVLAESDGWTRDRGARQDEVVSISWRRVDDAVVRTLWLNAWDPWEDVHIHTAVGTIKELEAFWASRLPMSADGMTPGDIELAVERGAGGSLRTFTLGAQRNWVAQADDAVAWLIDSPG